MGGAVAGQEYGKARDKGLAPMAAAGYANVQGAIELLTEKMPVGRLVGDIAARSPVAKTFIRQLALELPGEQVATFLQDLNEFATLRPEATIADFWAERPAAARDTALATIGSVGATVGLAHAGERTAAVIGKVLDRADAASQGVHDADRLQALSDAAAQSKLRQRDPEAFAALVRELAGDTGSTEAYVPHEAIRSFMQMDGYDGSFDDFRDQIYEAEITGGDVVLPLDTIVTRFAGTSAWDAIRDDLRLTPGGMSRREAQSFEDTVADHMADLSDQMAEEDRTSAEMGIPREKLFQAVADKIMNAGRTPSSARVEAEVLTSRAATRAARFGRELTGAEYDDLEIRQVLPPPLAAAQKADQLDLTISIMQKRVDAKKSAGPSLMDFIAANGGVEDPGGDLKAMGADKWHVGRPGKRRLVRETAADQPTMLEGGLGVNANTLDDMARRAWEAGYFPEAIDRPTVNDLLDAIAEGVAGRDRHTEAQDATMRDAAEALRGLLETRGIDPDKAARRDIRAAVDAYVAEQADGVTYEQEPDPLAVLTGDEIAPAGTPTPELRKAARAWYDSHLKGRTVASAGLGGRGVQFASSRKAFSSSADPRKLQAFAALEQLVASATLIETTQPRDMLAEASTRAYHYLEGVISLEGADTIVGVTVREDVNGNLFYNHSIRESTASGPLDTASKAGPGVRGSAYDQSIPENPDGINISVRSFDAGPRGRITFPGGGLSSGRTIIELFQARDQSTFLHEAGHLWLEEMALDAADPNAPQQIVDDWQATLDWFAANGHPVVDGKIPVDAHELWARGFERYLMEGKSPSLALRRTFQNLKAWLVGIYRAVARLKAPLTPEIRAVMDRLIATDEEIAAAIDAQALEALFPEKPPTMTEAEYAAYRTSTSGARDAAHDALLAKVMSGIKRRVTAEYREREASVRADVEASINTRPEFRALRALKDTPIDTAWVRETYGEDAPSLLPKQVPPVHKDKGANADEVAELSGFTSGDEMVRTLMGVETRRRELREGGDLRSVRKALIDQEVNETMLARYGDPFTDGTIEAEALDAVHSDQQGEVIASELRVLARSTGQRITPYSIARDWAARTIREGQVRDVASRSAILRYQRAAARAGKGAFEAVLTGDNVEAFRQKQAQMLNNALIAEAKKAADEVDAAVARLGKLATKRTVKGIDQDYLERIHELLERYAFRPISQRAVNERESFTKWVADQQAVGNEVFIPDRLADSAATHWSRMSVEELIGLDDAVKSLVHLGRQKQRLLDRQEQRLFDDFIDEAANLMEQTPGRRLSTDRDDGDRPVVKFLSGLAKVEVIAAELDNDQTNGPMTRLLVNRATDAENEREALRDRVLRPIAQRYLAMPRQQRNRLAEKVTVPELLHRGDDNDPRNGQPSVLTRMQIVAIALNTGNQSNLDKLTQGEGWSPPAVQTVLDRELRKQDWDFVQQTWDSLETLWPDIARVEKAMSGVEPERVEVRPVQTPFGTYRGGYYPAVYDPLRGQRAEDNSKEDANDMFGSRSGVSTAKGHTVSRTEFAAPMLLSVEGVLLNHVERVITRVAYAEYVRDVLRVMKNSRIRSVFDRKLGPELRGQIQPWLQRQINAGNVDRRGNGGAERFLRAARVNVTVVSMGLRWSTGVAQTIGIGNSIGRIGINNMRVGFKRMLTERGDAQAFVFARSPEMARRNEAMNRDVAEAFRQMQKKGGWVSKAQAFAFWHIGMIDRYVVSMPTWLGAHHKAMNEGMSDADASAYADKAVRLSQGSGREKDLSAWQSPNSEGLRTFTMFYTPFNVLLNAQWEAGRAVRRGDWRKAAMTTFWFMIATPLLDALVSGDTPWDDDDTEEGWSGWLARNIGFYLFAGLPLARDAGTYLERKMIGEYATFGQGPIGRIFESIGTLGSDAWNATLGDDEVSGKWVRHAIETPGYFLGLPTGQVSQTGQFGYDVATGEVNPDGFWDWYYGLTKGKVPEED